MADDQQTWRPSASLDTIRKRAELLQQLRAFFHARGVLEVETPLLSCAGNTEPNIESFRVEAVNADRYLHTSPEFAMKRLLAAGCGSIYQVCKVFRQDEIGRWHNPEFTMLEWYRTGFDHHALMDEVAQLLQVILGNQVKGVSKTTYQDAFVQHAGLDPLTIDNQSLVAAAAKHGFAEVVGLSESDRDAWLELLFDQVVVPRLEKNKIQFVYHYPASQAALAKIRQDEGVAERFEVYINGVELANGFHELTDAAEQAQRFERDNLNRGKQCKPVIPVDRHLLDGLACGLPACAGVALGLDRLLMLITGVNNLAEVISFDWTRA